MRFILVLLISVSLIIPYTSSAQTTGNGCFINNVVYADYLGMGYPYGVPSGQYRYYKSSGTAYPVNYNGYSATKPNNENYICNQINYYAAPVSKQEMTIICYSCCVTSATLGGSLVGQGGNYVSYNINKPGYSCSTSVPLDDHVFIYTLILSSIVFFVWRNRDFKSTLV